MHPKIYLKENIKPISPTTLLTSYNSGIVRYLERMINHEK